MDSPPFEETFPIQASCSKCLFYCLLESRVKLHHCLPLHCGWYMVMDIVAYYKGMRCGRVEERGGGETWDWWWEMLRMGVNLYMRKAWRQHKVAKGGNNLCQWEWLNQTEKPKPSQKNVSPDSDCWYHEELMNNRSHWREVQSCLYHLSLLWTDDFVFLTLPSLSIKEGNNTCPDSLKSCRVAYNCLLWW